ncbi:zinc-binding dehydrogenase [Phenylobacterium sp.]
MSTLFALLQEGRISPRIDRVFRLHEVRQAHEMLEAGGVQGRLVLDLRGA